jgi:ATP-dependent DNA ligase
VLERRRGTPGQESLRRRRNGSATSVKPELVAEVKFRTWTDDNLLRQVVYASMRVCARTSRRLR